MTYTLRELADRVGGLVVGDGQVVITGVQPFQEAGSGDLTLAAEKTLLSQLGNTQAAAIIVPKGIASDSQNLLQVDQPKVVFAQLLGLFCHRPFEALGISPLAQVSEKSEVADEVTIHPFAVVAENVNIERAVTLFPGVYVGSDCRIGEGSTLYPNVTLYSDVKVGKRVRLHSGSVIGADGFGYVFDGRSQVKVPQTGDVVIGDDVEIGANSCVDRATFGSTVIERGVKLDNHVHVGHNCRIGENTVVVAQVGISGSVRIGKECILAGQSGVIDHITIGDNVTVTVKTAVTRDVESGRVVSGNPVTDHQKWMREAAIKKRLPEIYRHWKHQLDRAEEE